MLNGSSSEKIILPQAENRNPAGFNIEKKQEQIKAVKDYAGKVFDDFLNNKEAKRDLLFFDKVNLKLNQIVGTETEWEEEGVFTQDFRDASEVFINELIEFYQANKNHENIERFDELVEENLFSASSNIAESLDLNQHFNLAAKATTITSTQNVLGPKLNSGLVYKISLNSEKIPEQLANNINNSTIAEKFDKAHLLEILTADYLAYGGDREQKLEKMKDLLRQIKEKNQSYFFDTYLELINNRIEEESQTPVRGIITFAGDKMGSRLSERLDNKQAEQSINLSEQFNIKLDRGEKVSQVGQDMVAILDYANRPIKFASVDFESKDVQAEIFEYQDIGKKYDYIFSQDKDAKQTALLLQHLHRPKMRQKIESDFGINLEQIPFRFQISLLRYISDKPENQINQIKNFIAQAKSKEEKNNRVKSFLSMEFNENSGDKILTIAEKLKYQEGQNIFNKYSEIADKALLFSKILEKSKFLKDSDLSSEIKNKLQDNLYDAILRRATDIIYTVYQLAEKGKAEAEFYNNRKIEVKDLQEVNRAIDIYLELMNKIEKFFNKKGENDYSLISKEQKSGLSIYDFEINDKTTKTKEYMTISLRPEGVDEHYQDLEFDGEARVNFLFSKEPISHNINDKSRREATTLRLDRECLVLNKQGEIIGHNNSRPDGQLSLDMGSIYEDSGADNIVLSNVVSVGNYYSNLERKKKPEYYHSKEAFYKELGEAEVFRKIVEIIESFIDKDIIKVLVRQR